MLFEPWPLGDHVAPSRVLFGPHVTNLGRDRSLSDAHVAYYGRRARGGCGVVVTETLSVHDSDWPYERAPLARDCAEGLRAIAEEVHSHGALLLASLGHAGLQGSTAYSQSVLWAPSLVPNVMTHEMPIAMDAAEIELLRDGVRLATRTALDAGCDGVELNAGQFSLFRQFLSGLTNHRTDEWGERSALVATVLRDVRDELRGAVLGLRVTGDELAPWAGITPDIAREFLPSLTSDVNYVVVERGSIFSEASTRPDMQAGTAFNRDLLAHLADGVPTTVSLVAQGSVVDVAEAQQLLDAGMCQAVEMTRAQIADPELVNKSRVSVDRVRPCVLCNQGCQVRDVRNPLVSCAVNPTAGYEREDAALDHDAPSATLAGRTVTVRGAGPAGLETARRLALAGADVTVLEKSTSIGGALRRAAQLPGRARWRELIAWYERELATSGVHLVTENLDERPSDVVAVGALPSRASWRDGNDESVHAVSLEHILDGTLSDGVVVVIDPVGHVVGVGIAELLASRGCTVTLVTPDLVAGTQLSLTGDLVAANARLAQLSVSLCTHAAPVAVRDGAVIVEDRYNGDQRSLAADSVVWAGFARPDDGEWLGLVVGDAVAPRTVYAAVLEGRRAAAELVTRDPS